MAAEQKPSISSHPFFHLSTLYPCSSSHGDPVSLCCQSTSQALAVCICPIGNFPPGSPTVFERREFWRYRLQICGQTNAHSRYVMLPSTAPWGSGRAGLTPPHHCTSSRSFQIFSVFTLPRWKAGCCWLCLYRMSEYAFLSHLMKTSDKRVMTLQGI